ncbi:nuclease [Flavobacterium arcticum]|uniref:Nuclease n=1 Tax=Flavobacterium arcticum TaxID=1784713 RepID=A0A345HEX5_9FLAO|nr:thermonuclease family protein [Flavobacterium arcticum]AXG75135.1 nuclease [Flavobacterium arcticum]KAF2511085.1 thermonuclease family protein [Flavobacterium arcticum]
MTRKQNRGRGKKKYSIWILLLILTVSIYSVVRNIDNKGGSKPQDGFVEKTYKKAKRPFRSLKTFTGKVVSIKDGDTFEVLYDGFAERIRLAEIDCPESKQAFGKAAKKYASDLCYGQIVTVESGGKRDQYGRVVGTVITQDGINVNEELVKAGLAWHYKNYSDSELLAEIENKARAKKVGLWADRNPTAPWQWRRKNRNHR